MRIRAWSVVCLCGITSLLIAADERSYTGWSDYLGGPDSAQYSALKQINKSNVSQLQVAWSYPTGDKNNYDFNPVIVDGVMYVQAKSNSIVALDAATGREMLGASQQHAIRHWARHQLLGKQGSVGPAALLLRR